MKYIEFRKGKIMKVFNFTDGKKGDLLGDIKIAGSHGGYLVKKGRAG
jgi:hypothetical protein